MGQPWPSPNVKLMVWDTMWMYTVKWIYRICIYSIHATVRVSKAGIYDQCLKDSLRLRFPMVHTTLRRTLNLTLSHSTGRIQQDSNPLISSLPRGAKTEEPFKVPTNELWSLVLPTLLAKILNHMLKFSMLHPKVELFGNFWGLGNTGTRFC